MRSLSSATLAALQARNLVARDFVWFTVRDRTTGAPVTDGYWSDVGAITAQVIDPDSGAAVSRTFQGSGTLIEISNIALVSVVQVQNVSVKLSQCADRVNTLIRTYDAKQAKIEIYRGLFDSATRNLVDPATPRFVGFVDEIEVQTGKEGEEGGVELTCVSHTQELTRSNPDMASDASQRLRSSTDNFFQNVAVVGDWTMFWGRASGPAS